MPTFKSRITHAPFWGDGSLCVYQGDAGRPGVEMRPITPFRARMRIDSFTRGMSAARLVLKQVGAEAEFEMFLTDLHDVLTGAGVAAGGMIVNEWWIVQKRGQNYGIRPCRADEIPAEAAP